MYITLYLVLRHVSKFTFSNDGINIIQKYAQSKKYSHFKAHCLFEIKTKKTHKIIYYQLNPPFVFYYRMT